MQDQPIPIASSEFANHDTEPRRPLSEEPLHWILLGMSAAVIMAACLLKVRGEEQVVLPLVDVPLPGTCSFKNFFGYDCPGCGLTRCFVSLGHRDLRRAWGFNPVGVFLFAVVAFQIPYRLIQLWRLRRGCQPIRPHGWGNLVLAGVAAALHS